MSSWMNFMDCLVDSLLADILQFLDDRYGELSADDLRHLTMALSVPFASVLSFRADAPKMNLSFTELSRFGHQWSGLQQMQYLQDATFDAMVTYIKTHVTLTPAAASGYVGSMTGSNYFDCRYWATDCW
eukprot:gene16269-11637_t